MNTTNTRQMSAGAVEIRERVIAGWLAAGITREQIDELMQRDDLRSVVNAFCDVLDEQRIAA